jgi:putative ABC transport system permease protein
MISYRRWGGKMEKFIILSLASMRKSKSAVISYGIILIFAALLLNLGVITQLNYGKNFEKKWDELRVATVFVSMLESDYKQSYEEYAKALEGITDTEVRKGLIINGTMKYAGSQMSMPNLFGNMDEVHRMNRIRVIEKLDKTVDRPIYLSYLMKAGGGYTLGDEYTLTARDKNYTFTVAGFVENLQYGSPNLGVIEVHLSQTEYDMLSKELGKSAEVVTLSAMAKDKNMGKALYSEIVNMTKGNTKEAVYGRYYEICKSYRTVTADIGAMIIVAFSLVIVAVSLLVIHFRVSNSIEEEMHNMGALKAIGYTSKQVIGSILFPYVLVGVLSIMSGCLLSYLVLPLLKAGFNAQTGVLWEQGFSMVALVTTFAVIFGLVMTAAYSSARKIRQLQPITALRSGLQVHSFKRNYFPLEKVPGNVNILLALKGFIANARQNVLLLLVMASVTVSALFAGVLYYNINIKSEVFLKAVAGEMPEVSFNLVESEDKERIKNSITQEPEVQRAIYHEVQEVLLNGETLSAFVTEDFSLLRVQAAYKGRSPIHENEISIGGPAAARAGKSIGDTITLSLGGEKKEYLITGLIQSTHNAGYVCEMTTKGFKRINAAYEPTWLYVYLKDGVGTVAFSDKITGKYGDYIAANTDFVESTKSQLGIFTSIVSIMGSIILIITAILVSLIVYLIIKTIVVRRKQEFGIQKAIGYTTGQLMLQMALSFLPTIFTGVCLGAIAGALGINPMLSILFRGIGIMKIEFLIPVLMNLIIAAGISSFSFIVALSVSRRIRRISAYSLIRE